jgi:molybdopterin molybdotransferase/putative molybdopterin biosynthesis protein
MLNRVRALRAARGVSQVGLAGAVRLSRQSLGAIEAGRSLPAVDVALRIARALECKVEDLFAPPAEAALTTVLGTDQRAQRVRVAEISGRWVSYALTGDGFAVSADAIAGHARRDHVEVDPLVSTGELRENLVLMGCATGLGLIAERLNSRAGAGRFYWVARSSTDALKALAKGHTHVAGVHLVDSKTGVTDLGAIRRFAGRSRLVVITFARWEAGLITAPQNPKRIHSVQDLSRRGLRLVVRERGSGARRLLDGELRKLGVPLALAECAPLRAEGHLQVARAVALGVADTGVATRDAALAFGLGFIPLAEECFDLVLPESLLSDLRLQRLLDAMTTATVRRELSMLGYDLTSTGKRVARVHAA